MGCNGNDNGNDSPTNGNGNGSPNPTYGNGNGSPNPTYGNGNGSPNPTYGNDYDDDDYEDTDEDHDYDDDIEDACTKMRHAKNDYDYEIAYNNMFHAKLKKVRREVERKGGLRWHQEIAMEEAAVKMRVENYKKYQNDIANGKIKLPLDHDRYKPELIGIFPIKPESEGPKSRGSEEIRRAHSCKSVRV